MKCPRCYNTEMVAGQAIKQIYETRGCFPGPITMNADEIKLIPCLKCPKCGHSDDGK